MSPRTEDGDPVTLFPCACGRKLCATKDRILPCCQTPSGIIHRLRLHADLAANWDPDMNPPYTDWSMLMEAAADVIDEHVVIPEPSRATKLTALLVKWFHESESDDYDSEDRRAVRFQELAVYGIDPDRGDPT